ncbi:MAG: hypothetical protein ACR2RB_09300 [Gammaproteobacteria bacterium]
MTTGTLSYLSNQDERTMGRLDAAVGGLARQYHRQLYARYLLGALFWGLVLASLAVLVFRLTQFPHSAFVGIALLFMLPLIAGAVMARRRQPGTLAIAIVADEKLKLKERLSTAWEYRQAQPDSDVTHALAVQAVGVRHPTVAGVFPCEFNLWGMLVPLAAALLILASIVDLERIVSEPTFEVDALVVDEGVRLKAFARQWRLRAAREAYPRSPTEAGNLQRLGARMQSGALDREQTLGRLRTMERALAEQRSAALLEATTAVGAGSTDAQSLAALDGVGGLALSKMLRRLRAGQLSPGDLEALDQAAETLAGLGVPADELRQALDQYAAGESQSLQRILEALSDADRNYRDAEELGRAQQTVARASENLGGVDTAGDIASQTGEAEASDEPGGAGAVAEDGSGELSGAGRSADSDSDRGFPPDQMITSAVLSSPVLSDEAQVTLRPKGRPGPGAVFKSETWALPNVGKPTVETVAIAPRFMPQMEEVLSRESYPLHRKEFVRRYFLNLSTGARGDVRTGEPSR